MLFEMKKEEIASAVDVSTSDITPYSREPIPAINAGDWEEASVAELWEQMNVLRSRYEMCLELGKDDSWLTPLHTAMKALERTIQIRSANTPENVLQNFLL